MKKSQERQKIQEILFRVEEDTFTPSDIDLLFIKLREFSIFGSVFHEISHFAAHNDNRDKGETFEFIRGFFNSFVFRIEHIDGKTVSLESPIPAYIIETIKYNIKASKINFQAEYKCSFTSFDSKFKNVFQKIKGTNSYKVKGTLKGTVAQVVYDMLQLLIALPLFNQDQIIDSILETLNKNNFKVNENLFRLRSDKIILFVILLLHSTEYNIDDHNRSKSIIYINTDKDTLELWAYIIAPTDSGSTKILFPLISTKINYSLFCTKKLSDALFKDVDIDSIIINNKNQIDLS